MKRVKKTIGIIIGVALLLCIGLLVIYQKAAYNVFCNLTAPKKEAASGGWENGTSYEKVPYSDVSPSDYVDIYVPNNVENPPLLVLAHGGGFIFDDSQNLATKLFYQYFRDNGYACASVNYRLAQEAQFPGALEDVKACIRFLRANASSYGYNADRIALWGESAGGYLATMAAVTNDSEFSGVSYLGQEKQIIPESASVQVLLDYYGCVELGNMNDDWKELGIPQTIIDQANAWISKDSLEGYSSIESFWCRKEFSLMTEEEKAYVNPNTYIDENIHTGSDFSVFISHGDCDITVPKLQSMRLYDKLSTIIFSTNIALEIVPKAGHGGAQLFSEEALGKVKQFLDTHMK